MGRSALQVDFILSGGTIITMNESRDVIENAALVINKGEIVWAGKNEQLPSHFLPSQQIKLKDSVIIPGLVNVHGHWAMTLFRGLLDDCTLEKWLNKIWKVEAAIISKDSVVLGAQLAMVEMIRSGTTCAADMYWYYSETTETAREVGFRIVNGPSFALIEGFEDYRNTNDQIALEYLQKYQDVPLVHTCVQAHSAYTTNPEILERVARIVHDRDLVFITHASESKGEMSLVLEKYGKRPIEVLDSFDLLGPNTLLAHCVHLNDDEIDRLAETGTAVAHCPSSNLKLSSGIARVADMIEKGVTVGIGTDGPASNNDLDLFHEAQLAALVQKGVTGEPRALPAEKVFAMLTIDGARAVGLNKIIGSIEVGKRADLCILDFDAANLIPCYDYYSHLIYAIAAADVRDVMVNGRLLMRNCELLTIDEEEVKHEIKKIAQQIRKV